MSFDLKNLELFVRVAALGAIGRAGAEFSLSATNASQRIQSLEADLGVKLLNRTTRSVSLTPDGEIFLEHARRIVQDVQDARTVLSHKAHSVSGRLRVTASATFGMSFVVPFVPEFLRLYPDVQLDLHLTDALVDIVDQGYDLAFRLGELAPSSLLAQKIDENPRVLVASPEYLERAGAPQRPQDLTRHACLNFGDQSLWKLANTAGEVHEIRVSGPVTVTHGEAVGEWALAGMGIANGSLWATGPDLRAGRLVRVLPDYRGWPETRIWAVRPPGRLMHARVKAFLDFMRDRIVATGRERTEGIELGVMQNSGNVNSELRG
ncbi:LysR family transcriptional regulator [Tropicimonas sediminicola]|uniref:Transcriptional regulator, LysR family n=1 Tax=Tropicimonas sediminicola TaxID=1031541 RepID=A0A239FTV3_9RHOB|nr:LysR family transcriptional regulator [Tropicimonas sediminicola]SNS59582.1 transcriptional regulator, LysR family [Tropicimonas sediminicola]